MDTHCKMENYKTHQTILNRNSLICLVTMVMMLLWTCPQTVTSNSGYVLVAPAVFRAHTEEVISISVLQPSQPIYVELKLFSSMGHVIAEAGHEIFGKGTINLKIPGNVKGRCTLKVCGNCRSPRSDEDFTFYNSTVVRVEASGTSAFIQMDKPIYKPSQTVMFNVITTGSDLKPVNDQYDIYILDPHGARISQWLKVQPVCCGLVNLSYPLSDQPLLGKWTLFVKLQGKLYSKSFEVQKYVLPKFQVAIYPPDFIVDWTQCQPVYVRARYTYEQPVKGRLQLTAQVQGVGYYHTYTSLQAHADMQINGIGSFNICISDLMEQPTKDYFRGMLTIEAEVTAQDGSKVKATDASCPVNKNLIDLEFTKDTRSHFKPGLPYTGKLSVYYPDGSPADNVTVQLRTDIHTWDSAVQELLSSRGTVHFTLPPIPPTVHVIWLEAQVTQIEGKEVSGTQYLPTYKSISSWYSPSQCHIMIDPITDNLQVGDEAKFNVHSTCSCNFTMYYEVVSRGNIVHSGLHFARHVQRRSLQDSDIPEIMFTSEDETVSQNETYEGSTSVCRVSIKMRVDTSMAPYSRLVAYYVKPDGEAVADSILFNIKPAFKNRVTIALNDREVVPGSTVDMRVHTRPGSLVCVAAVDQTVHLLRPGYQLNIDEVFEELESYDVTNMKQLSKGIYSYPLPYGSRAHRRRRSVLKEATNKPKDALYAFEEVGLMVLTDQVRLHFQQQEDPFQMPPFYNLRPRYQQLSSSQRSLQEQHKHSQRTRTFFPETWLWKCFNMSTNRQKEKHRLRVPDSITSWQFEGLSINNKHGLALSHPVQLHAFQQFFVDFTIPYEVVRGEQVNVPLVLHNYLRSCVRTQLKLALRDGIESSEGVGGENVTEVCVAMQETRTIHYLLTFTQAASTNISVEAKAYADHRCCSGIIEGPPPGKKSLVAQDKVIKKVKVEAEGLPRYYTHSLYFCPNERHHFTTPNIYEFQFMKKPALMTNFSFMVKASNDVRVALALSSKLSGVVYEIVLGGLFNDESWISEGAEGFVLVNASTPGILSSEEYKSFWISWDNGNILVGLGENMNESSSFLEMQTNRAEVFSHIGFSTGWGAKGDFKIWTKDEETGEGGFGEIFNLGLPSNTVQDSVTAIATVTGDVMGPTLYNVEELLRLPSGCGEQNMIHFAPNVFVLNYLGSTGQLTGDLRKKALALLATGYQKQLTYKRSDGSYSAFGDMDATGNMWLTAFVLKCFGQGRRYMYIDELSLTETLDWVLGQQLQSGAFPPMGRLINKQIQGGVDGQIALTAYVVTALIEVGSTGKFEHHTLSKARAFLEDNLSVIKDPYTTSLVAYALTLLSSSQATTLLRKLNTIATQNDGFTYWKLEDKNTMEDTILFNEEPSERKVSSAEIETAAYALLTVSHRGDMGSALPIVKWLSHQRNALGGFSSTQDTCIALQALSQYASLAYMGPPDLTISIASTNMDLHHRLLINGTNVQQSVKIPSLPTGLFISANGGGCGLIQVNVKYNIPDPSTKPAFLIDVTLGIAASSGLHEVSHDNLLEKNPLQATLNVCTEWLHTGASNMAVLELGLLTGFIPAIASLDELLKLKHIHLKRYEIRNKIIYFYFDEIKNGCATCISIRVRQELTVGRTSPASVRIYDYYEPSYEATVLYNSSHMNHLLQNVCGSENKCYNYTQNISDPVCFSSRSQHGCHPQTVQCSCNLGCKETKTNSVCGSDGQVYQNECHMSQEACFRDVHLEMLPMHYCFQEEESDGSSGELAHEWPDSIYADYEDSNALYPDETARIHHYVWEPDEGDYDHVLQESVSFSNEYDDNTTFEVPHDNDKQVNLTTIAVKDVIGVSLENATMKMNVTWVSLLLNSSKKSDDQKVSSSNNITESKQIGVKETQKLLKVQQHDLMNETFKDSADHKSVIENKKEDNLQNKGLSDNYHNLSIYTDSVKEYTIEMQNTTELFNQENTTFEGSTFTSSLANKTNGHINVANQTFVANSNDSSMYTKYTEFTTTWNMPTSTDLNTINQETRTEEPTSYEIFGKIPETDKSVLAKKLYSSKGIDMETLKDAKAGLKYDKISGSKYGTTLVRVIAKKHPTQGKSYNSPNELMMDQPEGSLLQYQDTHSKIVKQTETVTSQKALSQKQSIPKTNHLDILEKSNSSELVSFSPNLQSTTGASLIPINGKQTTPKDNALSISEKSITEDTGWSENQDTTTSSFDQSSKSQDKEEIPVTHANPKQDKY